MDEKRKKDQNRKKDLEDVMRTESRRGRRPVDIEARQKRNVLLEDMRKLLLISSEAEFLKAMRGAGLLDGSQELSDALKAWRKFQS